MAGVSTIQGSQPFFGMQTVASDASAPRKAKHTHGRGHGHDSHDGDRFVGHRDTGVDPKDLPLGRRICTRMIRWYQENKLFHGGKLTFSCTYPQKAEALGKPVASCSQYTLEAIQKHGVIKGILLGSGRIMNCNPVSQKIGFLKDRFVEA